MNPLRHLSALAPILLCLLLILCSSSQVFAHKIRIFAWEEGNTVHSESKFSGGKAAKNSDILVTEAQSGKVLLTGKTDSKGAFSFPIPSTETETLKIEVNSGDGHKNSWLHDLSTPQQKRTVAETRMVTPPTPPATTVENSKLEHELSYTQPNPSCDQQEMMVLFETVLEKKLAPLRRTLAENSNSKPTLKDILGGIGYILGLAGIAAYFKSKTSN